MTMPYDPRELDLAWDSLIAGGSSAGSGGDETDRDLLALLGALPHSVPSSQFVHSLERALFNPVESMNGHHAVSARPASRQTSSRRRSRIDIGDWIPGRWSHMRYASIAIALVLVLSSVAIVLQRQGVVDDFGSTIPAASEWTNAGPPTSPGVETATLFSHTFSVDELADYAFDQWGWIQFAQGTVEPHQHSTIPNGEQYAKTMTYPGISFIEVERGQLTARLDQPALVGDRTVNSRLAQVQAGTDVTLEPGETLVFGIGTLSQFWNPTGEEAAYVAGGLYTKPDLPILFPGSEPNENHTGTSFPASKLAGVGSLNISTAQVTIDPGDTYAYVITGQTLLLGNVIGGGLTNRSWSKEARDDVVQSFSAGMHTFHRSGPGYYTLTNNGSEPVDVFFMQVAPPVDAGPQPVAPAASVETLFDHAFSQADLGAYGASEWGWIELVEDRLNPGEAWSPIDGSHEAANPKWPGMTLLSLESGELAIHVAKPVTLFTGPNGAVEEIPADSDLTLTVGDALVFGTGAVERAENHSIQAAVFLSGGFFDRPHYTGQITNSGTVNTPGGTSFSSDLPANATSADASMRKVHIEPGESYFYTLTPSTLLIADVTGEGLRKAQVSEDAPGEPSHRLLVSMYTLSNDNPGDYRLANTGSDPVDVYLFGLVMQSDSKSAAMSGLPASAQ